MIFKWQLKRILNLDDEFLRYERRGLHFQVHYGCNMYGTMNRYIRTVKEAHLVRQEIAHYMYNKYVYDKPLDPDTPLAYEL